MEAFSIWLRRMRARYRAVSGWRLSLLLFVAGAFSILGHAPFFFFPAFVLAIFALVLALDHARRAHHPLKAGFFRAWWFACGQFLAGTAWVANAFLVSAGDHAWLIWAPLVVLPAGLALFWGGAGILYVKFAPRGVDRVSIFVLAFMGVEFLRSTVLSGFPWNLPGHVFEAGAPISQGASLVGAYGLSVLALYAAAAPAALVGKGRLRARFVPIALSATIIVSVWIFGAYRLSNTPVQETDHRLQLVQVNLPQREKRYENRYHILDQYLQLSAQGYASDVDAIIWPEGAIPAFLLNSQDLLSEIGDTLPQNARLITGTPRAELGSDRRATAYFNALVSMTFSDGMTIVEAEYDKAKLVPFGESNPFKALTRWIGFETLVEAAPSYDPGEGAQTIQVGSLPAFGPLICYEAIYPRFIQRGPNRPEWLINISNDSWYGNSSGPSQLVNQTQYRSIEEGLPLIRVATAGISGQIDPLGRISQSLTVNQDESLIITLLVGLDAPPYARYGNALWMIALLILASTTRFLAVAFNTPSSGGRATVEGC